MGDKKPPSDNCPPSADPCSPPCPPPCPPVCCPPVCSPQKSELECTIIYDQAERRARYRQQFLIERTDPCKHCLESGFVFDKSIQQFISMKATQYEHFSPSSPRNILFGLGVIVLPMLAYGYLIWNHRAEREHDIRCGFLRYKDRLFKLQ